MVLMAGLDLPSRAIREQIVSAIQLVVYIRRYEDGVRRIQSISELTGMEGDTPQLQDIFRFEPKGRQGNRIAGSFVATGTVPRIVEEMRANDVDVPMHLFQPPVS